MTFSEFVTKIFTCFNTVFTNLVSYIEILLENNFIKFIIYLSILSFIITLLTIIIGMIYNILNYKHDKESNDLEKTDVIKAENGGRIRKKDLWW